MTTSEEAKTNERLRELMEGDARPSNEFVDYHIKMARAAQAELVALVQSIAKSTKRLGLLKRRAIVLRAQIETHLQTVTVWDHQAGNPPSSGPAL